MFESPIDGLSNDAGTALAREGLPYWIFWLLLCVIVLLGFFVFLRNKDLRQRLSLTLHGPRRRFNRIALQARLLRENKKKTALLQALGRTALRTEGATRGYAPLVKRLDDLESRLDDSRGEVRSISARLEVLRAAGPGGRRREETPGESQKSKAIRKDLKRILSEIALLERRQDPLLEELGAEIHSSRPERKPFLPLYAQIDLADESIAELEARIAELKKG
jgi:chromosome segregation ATPase